ADEDDRAGAQVQVELLLEERIGPLELVIAGGGEDDVLPITHVPMQLEDLHRVEGLECKVGFQGLGHEGDARSTEPLPEQPIIVGGQKDWTDTPSSQARQRLVQLDKGARLSNVLLQLQSEIGL